VKAVILAGGLGTRMGEETALRPKPMIEVGGRPILWHIMKILSSQGISEFIICTGYKADVIREYFLNFRSTHSDFTISYSEGDSLTFHDDLEEASWKVTVADTGPLTMTGGRIKAVEKYLEAERFLVTYGDGIADVNLTALLSSHESSGAVATLSTTSPSSRFGVVRSDQNGLVTEFLEKPQGSEVINIGYFIMEPEVFEYLGHNSVLEQEPLRILAAKGKLNSRFHDGFWQPMDTAREAVILNNLWSSGNPPWKIW